MEKKNILKKTEKTEKDGFRRWVEVSLRTWEEDSRETGFTTQGIHLLLLLLLLYYFIQGIPLNVTTLGSLHNANDNNK